MLVREEVMNTLGGCFNCSAMIWAGIRLGMARRAAAVEPSTSCGQYPLGFLVMLRPEDAALALIDIDLLQCTILLCSVRIS